MCHALNAQTKMSLTAVQQKHILLVYFCCITPTFCTNLLIVPYTSVRLIT